VRKRDLHSTQAPRKGPRAGTLEHVPPPAAQTHRTDGETEARLARPRENGSGWSQMLAAGRAGGSQPPPLQNLKPRSH